MARKRASIESFSEKDRSNLLDLFVNNEKTLLKIYEALFPHRTSHIADKTRGRFRGGGGGAGAYGSVSAANKSMQHYGSFKDDVVLQHLPHARGVSDDEGRGPGRRNSGSAGGTKLPTLGI